LPRPAPLHRRRPPRKPTARHRLRASRLPRRKPPRPSPAPPPSSQASPPTWQGAGATIGALAIIGGLFYFLRKRRGKGPLQIWQSFRKKGNAEARDPVLEEPAVAAEG
jgi:pilus assembly protein FimV